MTQTVMEEEEVGEKEDLKRRTMRTERRGQLT